MASGGHLQPLAQQEHLAPPGRVASPAAWRLQRPCLGRRAGRAAPQSLLLLLLLPQLLLLLLLLERRPRRLHKPPHPAAAAVTALRLQQRGHGEPGVGALWLQRGALLLFKC